LSLLFVLSVAATSRANQKKHAKKKGVVHAMTVLEVQQPQKDETYIGVSFRVSQRIYKLPKDANPKYLELLKQSERQHTPVMVWRAKEESDVIVSVEKQ
jgi:hypothetical protein